MSTITNPILESFCLEPKDEISNIKKSYEEHLLLNPSKTYKPRLVLFDFFSTKKLGISCKDYIDEKDFFVSISEMLYSYSAFYASSCILVLDSNNKVNEHTTGSLIVYFVSDDMCAILSLYYRQNQDNTVEWVDQLNTCEQIDLKSKDSSVNKIVELLFVYTHIDPPFTKNQLLSYYSLKKYKFKSFKDLNTSYINYNIES